MLRRSLLLLSMVLAVLSIEAVSSPIAEAAPPEADSAVISGVVKDSRTELPIANATVLLYCSCFSEPRRALSDARGIYSFGQLLPGHYTLQLLAGRASVSKVLTLPPTAKYRANFACNPEQNITIIIQPAPITNIVTGEWALDLKALVVSSHSCEVGALMAEIDRLAATQPPEL